MTEDNDDITIPDDLTSLHKEIDLIQNCISRMAQNSFMIKGWAVTAIVITWTIIGIAELDFFYIMLLLIPIVCFWGLDAFFVVTEKRFRELYNWVLNKRLYENSTEKLYDLNPLRFKKNADSWLKCVRSKTLLPFYGCMAAIVLITTIVIKLIC